MLDYKEIIIRHYGGGMSGRALAEQGFGSKSGINDFLSAFEACERLSFPLPEGITNYGIAELVYGADEAGRAAGRDTSFEYPDYAAVHIAMANRKNMTMVFQWNQYKRVCEETEKKYYSYRQFCANYEAWCRENEETMHFQAVIAQKMVNGPSSLFLAEKMSAMNAGIHKRLNDRVQLFPVILFQSACIHEIPCIATQ